MKTWLLIDGQYLAHRAKHSTGDLSHEGIATGVAFGVLRDLESLHKQFDPFRTVLAFDHRGDKLRKQILPSYKSTRELKKTDVDRERDAIFYPELDRLKEKILPELGYRNILEVPGYEADDILAWYAAKIPQGHQGIIVSADKDLWQCLSGSSVLCFNPASGKLLDSKMFFQEWRIDPIQWAHVKALAGCKTDDVDGIDGIGDKSAAGWFNGTLKAGSKKWELISANIDVIQKNLPLVKLPFPGLKLPRPEQDFLSEEKRVAVLQGLGIQTERKRKKIKVDVVTGEVSRLF